VEAVAGAPYIVTVFYWWMNRWVSRSARSASKMEAHPQYVPLQSFGESALVSGVRFLVGHKATGCYRWVVVLLWVLAITAHAETAAFDLIGPRVNVRVQRAGATLPISEVPNLQAGDRLWIQPDLPDTQSAHYLMIVVFLRGATNPPPESWFIRVETWTKPVHEEGVFVTVPEEAEEALIFLAPETGGGFTTLRGSVRAKPGAFVRAAQDLQQASWDRARLEKYLDAVRALSSADPEELHARTILLARSLNIRLEQQCFDKPTAQQAPCLTQNTDQLVLDDAHAQTMVATLTSGAPVDLLAQISSTPSARYGFYSPYIGAVVDMARILGSAHVAQYQYIPALAMPKQDELNLRLNNPPSFRNPKSVLVIGLPPIAQPVLPPLKAIDPRQIFCVANPTLVLPVDGAPLVFVTNLAHHMVLHVPTKTGDGIDLPAEADPARGGIVVNTQSVQTGSLSDEITGVLHGDWGFKPFDGPRFHLRTPRAARWKVASKDASALIVGREDTLHLQSEDASCVSEVTMKDAQGKSTTTPWKMLKPDEIEVRVPLQDATAGSVTMMVKKFGLKDADEIPLHTYAEAGRLDNFTIHAGDPVGVLKGTRLDEVTTLELGALHFKPGSLSRANQQDELKLISDPITATSALNAGDPVFAHVTLKDGRVLEVKTIVDAPRPRLELINKSVQPDPDASRPVVHLGNPDELPQDAKLNFFLRVQSPESFPPSEKIEVATADESFRVLLSMADGNLTLQDSKTVFAVLDPMKHLGPSAFGPLKFRPVGANNVDGDWHPLADLVRIPTLEGVRCVTSPEKQCFLSGEKLFLLDSVSADPEFSSPLTVPDGFVDQILIIPPLKNKTLYIKLRDDPSKVASVILPTLAAQQ
jgi:hypothetical protein